MSRTDPNFKEKSLTEQEDIDFIDEMFDELFDTADVHSDTDKVPDLSEVR
jgi:hypothetical protein